MNKKARSGKSRHEDPSHFFFYSDVIMHFYHSLNLPDVTSLLEPLKLAYNYYPIKSGLASYFTNNFAAIFTFFIQAM